MVPPYSHGISRVPRYSGFSLLRFVFTYMTFTFFGRPSHTFLLIPRIHIAVHTPAVLLPPVWPPPLSLATTCGISVDFFSSPYLDVSVQAVSLIHLLIQCMIRRHYSAGISPFGHPRINGYLLLPVAFRSLSRPSSAPSAKAFALRSF